MAAERWVLVVALPPPVTGQSIAAAMLVEHLAERGTPHAVIDISGGFGRDGRIAPLLGRMAQYLGKIAAFVACVWRRPAPTVYLTIAQSARGFARDLCFVWIAAAARCRIVLHLHGGNYQGFYLSCGPLLRWVVRSTLRRADLIIVLGEGLRGMFDFDPELAQRIAVVPNGLPTADVRGVVRRLPEAGPVRVLYLSNLIQSKGYVSVLEAAARLARERPGRFEFRFCGEFMASPDDRDPRPIAERIARFDAFVAEHGLDASVARLGSVGGAAKQAELDGAHLFVLPTDYAFEGQPISIIEALANGLPVITTRFRAIPDLIEAGINGAFVPFGDAATLAAAIDAAVADPARYEAQSAAATRAYQLRFTRERHLEALCSAIADVRPPAGGRR